MLLGYVLMFSYLNFIVVVVVVVVVVVAVEKEGAR